MYRIAILICLILAGCKSSSAHLKVDKPVTVIYDYGVRDNVIVEGGIRDVELKEYHLTLSKNFTQSLEQYYCEVIFRNDDIPENGTTFLISAIVPKITKEKNNLVFKIWYYGRIWQNKKMVREINDTIRYSVMNDNFSNEKITELIILTHQKMTDQIAKEVIKSEKSMLISTN